MRPVIDRESCLIFKGPLPDDDPMPDLDLGGGNYLSADVDCPKCGGRENEYVQTAKGRVIIEAVLCTTCGHTIARREI